MAMKLRIKFDGSCPRHPKFNPAHTDPTRYRGFECQGCEELHIIWEYSMIVQKHVDKSTILTKENVGFIIPAKLEGEKIIPQTVVTEEQVNKLTEKGKPQNVKN